MNVELTTEIKGWMQYHILTVHFNRIYEVGAFHNPSISLYGANIIVLKTFIRHTVRLLTHVLCKPTHFFFHSFIATMSYSRQTSFNSLPKDWADKYLVWGTPTRSPSRSNSR